MSLKDELLKAKLISKKQLKRLEHQDRVEKKQLGQGKLQGKKQQQLQAIEKKQQQKKQQDQQRAKREQEKRLNKEKLAQIRQIINQGKLQGHGAGNRKFYFVTRNGKIPFILVSDDLMRQLERGEMAIIEPGDATDEFVVVDGHSANKLNHLQRDIVRFYQK